MGLTEERYERAREAALRGLREGGIPIGAALFIGDRLVSQGWNKRVQQDSPILHAEMDCLAKAGRPDLRWRGRRVLYTTLSPCFMCAGASLIFGLDEIVIGENRTVSESENLLASRGVVVRILDDEDTFEMFSSWAGTHKALWAEDRSC